jgi:hypothetical protein
MSRMPEASFCSSAPAALGPSRASSSVVSSVLYWLAVGVLAVVGWAASAHLHVAHARDVSWSVGVHVPGGVIHARTEPPVVIYQAPVPVYRAPVVVQRPPAYIVSPPAVVWSDHNQWDERRRWEDRQHRHHRSHRHGHNDRYDGYSRYEGPRYPDPYAHRNAHPHQRGDW